MFDLGFWEMALVVLVALIVIGPERLPQVMRTTGLWLGRLRNMSNHVRQELEQELYNESIKSQEFSKEHLSDVKQMIDDVGNEFQSLGREIQEPEQHSLKTQGKRQSSAETVNDDK
ncbi:MAG: Sec-independent protein translocase protein TatB [Gammaproteobacteria bacterium]|nr:Sec-independent protein translocase protein TatB [Gammaproteobacteria bacterium]